MNDEQQKITRRRFVAGSLVTGATAAWPAAAEAAKRKRQRKRKHSTQAESPQGRCGRGRRRLRRLDRRPPDRERRPLGDRARGARPRRRAGLEPRPRRRSGVRARRDVRRPDPGPHHGAGQRRRRRDVPDLRHRRRPVRQQRRQPAGADRPERYSDTGPLGTAPPDPTIAAELVEVVQQLDQMSTEVPVDAPWTASNASSWDGQTLQSWVDANSVTPRFQALVPAATRPIFGAEPRELSLLFVLFYIAASGNEQNAGTFERNFDTRNGAQQSRFIGGTQEIAIRVAAALGDRVLLNSPVQRIVQDKAGAVVHTDRRTITAKRVIVAIPPVLAGRIQYEPGAAVRSRPADPALPAGHADQGRGRLRHSVLARQRPDRRGARHRRARERVVRRLAAVRLPGRPVRVRRRRQRAQLQRDVGRQIASRRSSTST